MVDEPSSSVEPENSIPYKPDLERLIRSQKVRDLLIGLIGGLVLNGALTLSIYGLYNIKSLLPGWFLILLVMLAMFLILVINIGLPILAFIKERPYIAFGILLPYMVGFVSIFFIGMAFNN